MLKISNIWSYIERAGLKPTPQRMSVTNDIGLLSFINSPANIQASIDRIGDVEVMKSADGKAYKVVRRVLPRYKAQTTLEGVSFCSAEGDVLKPVVDEVEIDKKLVSNPILIDDKILRCILENKEEYVNHFVTNYVRSHIDNLGRAVATQVAKFKRGNFYNCDCDQPADVIRNLPLYTSSGQAYNPIAGVILDRDRLEAQISDPFVLIGGTKLAAYQRLEAVQSGQDIGIDGSRFQLGQQAIYYDTNVGAALADNDIVLAVALGALRMVTYAKNKGTFAYEDDTQIRQTVIDPFFGLEHDMIIFIDKCEEEVKYKMQLITHYTILDVPACWNGNDCNFDGVNDVFTYRIVCEDSSVCDLDVACGKAQNAQRVDLSCDESEICATSCKAIFDANEIGVRVHSIELEEGVVSAVTIGGVTINLDSSYDVTNSTQFAALLADLNAKLGNVDGVYSVSGFATADPEYVIRIVTVPSITAISLTVGGDVTPLGNFLANTIWVQSYSVPSTDCELTDLSWVIGGDVLQFAGAPDAFVNNPAVFGTYSNFFITAELTGETIQLTISDSCDCSDLFDDVLP
jgi:hypothetical protein